MLPITRAVNGNAGVRVRKGSTAAGWLSVKGTRPTVSRGTAGDDDPADPGTSVGWRREVVVADSSGRRARPAQRLLGNRLGCGEAAAVALHAPAVSSVPSPAQGPGPRVPSSLHPRAGSAAFDAPVVYSNGCHDRSQTATRAALLRLRRHVGKADGRALRGLPRGAVVPCIERRGEVGAPEAALHHQVGVSGAERLGPHCIGAVPACDVWRDKAIALINKRGHVNLVVFAGSSRTHPHQAPHGPGHRHPKGTGQGVAPRSASYRARSAGTADDIVIMRDTPHMRLIAGSCLRSTGRRQPPGCQTAYSAAYGEPFSGSERLRGEGIFGCRDRGLHLGLLHDDPVPAGHEHPCAPSAGVIART